MSGDRPSDEAWTPPEDPWTTRPQPGQPPQQAPSRQDGPGHPAPPQQDGPGYPAPPQQDGSGYPAPPQQDGPGYLAQPQQDAPAYPAQPGYYPSAPPPGQMGPVPAVPGVSLASWSLRVGGYLIDSVVSGLPIALAEVVLYATIDRGRDAPSVVGVLAMVIGIVAAVALWIWNRGVRQGAGQSIGKQIMGLQLISEQTHGPVGTGTALLRDVVHVVDGIFYLGYLWPLWDPKKQTFADKIMTTLSVRA